MQSRHKPNVCLDKCSFSDCHFLCWRSSCKGQEKEAWEYLFRRKKYAASTLSEVTNTTKLRSQGSFLVFSEGEKKQRKCNDLAFLLTMTIFENFLTRNFIFIYASFTTILPQFPKILKVYVICKVLEEKISNWKAKLWEKEFQFRQELS